MREMTTRTANLDVDSQIVDPSGEPDWKLFELDTMLFGNHTACIRLNIDAGDDL